MRPLKFKEIRKSIINHKQFQPFQLSPNKSPLRKNFYEIQQETEMSFKSIKQSTMSPLKAVDTNIQHPSTNKKNKFLFEEASAQRQNLSPLSNKKRLSELQRSKGMCNYDSDRKTMGYHRITSNFGSDQKENNMSSIYMNREHKQNFPLMEGTVLNFISQKQRKLNTMRHPANNLGMRPENCSNILLETAKNSTPGSLTKKSSTSMLFKTALESSNKKKTARNNIDSDRSTARQSSIGKLKQRLFGMKRVISEKQNKPSNKCQSNDGQQTKSFTIYTINMKNSTDERAQQPRPSFNSKRQQPQQGKTDEHASFSNLIVNSINKGLKKPAFKHLLNLEDNVVNQNKLNLLQLNDSRIDSVNISVAESCDSELDMSPNI